MKNAVMENFTMRLSAEDKRMLIELAQATRRSKSNTIRFFIGEAYSKIIPVTEPITPKSTRRIKSAKQKQEN